MTENTPLSVVTTTDPVARQLPFLLTALSDLAMLRRELYEVIIVDDLGQWDLEEPPAKHALPGLTVKAIHPQTRQGQLLAIQKGLEQATSPVILTIDPDLHPCVIEIPQMLDMLNGSVMAVHAVRKTRPDIGFFRARASEVVNAMVRLITGLRVRDIGSPITLFRRDVLTMIPTIPSRKQPNLRLSAYIMLGNRLACYNLRNGSDKHTSSHYGTTHLFGTTWRLVRDAIKIRCYQILPTSRRHNTSK